LAILSLFLALFLSSSGRRRARRERATNNKTKWRRLIAEIRSDARSQRTGSTSGGGAQKRVRKGGSPPSPGVRSAIWGPRCEEDPSAKRDRLLAHSASSVLGVEFTFGPWLLPRHLLLLLLLFSLLLLSLTVVVVVSLSLYLEAREARTTCLLEKSARLPWALINLHSAR